MSKHTWILDRILYSDIHDFIIITTEHNRYQEAHKPVQDRSSRRLTDKGYIVEWLLIGMCTNDEEHTKKDMGLIWKPSMKASTLLSHHENKLKLIISILFICLPMFDVDVVVIVVDVNVLFLLKLYCFPPSFFALVDTAHWLMPFWLFSGCHDCRVLLLLFQSLPS